MTPPAHPKPKKPRQRLKRGEGDRLREEILDAAEQLMVAAGDANAVSIRAISGIVQVTAPSIYRHFADKDALVYAACVRAYERFDDYIDKAAADATDPLHDIKIRAIAYINWAIDNPGQYRVLFMADAIVHDAAMMASSFDANTTHIEGLRQLDRALQTAIAQGLVGPIEPTMEATILLWSMVHGIASLRIAHPTMPWPSVEAAVERLFTMLALGICSPSARGDLEALAARPSTAKRRRRSAP